jgi:hypothetical protein
MATVAPLNDESVYGLHCNMEYPVTSDGAVAHLELAYEYHAVDAGAHYISVVDVRCKHVEPAKSSGDGEPMERDLDGFWRNVFDICELFQAECERHCWAHWWKAGQYQGRAA